MKCFNCKAEIPVSSTTTIGRRDTCDACDADVRVCLNCTHYDPAAYNECKEPQADRVVDKDRANFCDYFSPGSGDGSSSGPSKEDVFAQLDNLFKK